MEAYVQPFPALDGRWQVSQKGGNSPPQWRRDGKELYYAVGQTIWAAPVINPNPLQLGAAHQLFAHPRTPRGSFWTTSPDGQCFLFAVEGPESSPTKFDVVVNWSDLLRARQ
jgi:hypothetical protein